MNETMVIKRDGREITFQPSKIEEAVVASMKDTEIGIDLSLATLIANNVSNNIKKNIKVEEVQDMVENELMSSKRKDVAKAYMMYRAKRSRIRDMDSNIMQKIRNLTYQSAEENPDKRENANVDGDTAMGTMLKYGTEAAKEFYTGEVLNPKHAKAHKDGDYHIHDLDFLTLTTTCSQIDLKKLFKNGFSTGHGYLREPNSINSYGALAAIAIQSNQNDQHR